MYQNAWIKDGGFYGEDAPIISGAGLDVAAHPQVLLKKTEAYRIVLEKLSDKYREKILGLVWIKNGFNDAIDFSVHGGEIFRIIKKLESESGGILDKEKEGKIFYRLLERGIIGASGLESNGNKATVTCEIGPEIANIFEDVTGNKNIQNIVAKVSQGLVERGVTEEDWIQALKYCADDSFMANMGILNGGKSKEDRLNRAVMKLKNPIILLRFHGLTMEAYRGNNPGKNQWLKENGSRCISCGEEIPGSQNFTRVHGATIHTSCIPEHLEKNPVRDKDFADYLWAVYHAMFPKKRQEG